MHFYDHQISYNESFHERVGDPLEFHAALGKIVQSFSYLEECLRNLVVLFLDVPTEIGKIVTAELSYKGIVHMASSLFKYKNHRGDFVVEGENCAERFNELMALCFTAEEHRNTIIHSSYVSYGFRVKTTAKAKHGLKTLVEPVDSSRLLDISDFISTIGVSVEELPMHLNIATSVRNSNGMVLYYDGDRILAAFGGDHA